MITHSVSTRNELAAAIKAMLEDGIAAGGPIIRIYTVSDVVLVEFRPTYGSVSNGVITVSNAPITATAVASGEPSWFAAMDSDEYLVYHGTAGRAGSDLIVSPNEIVAGNPVQLTSHRYIASA